MLACLELYTHQVFQLKNNEQFNFKIKKYGSIFKIKDGSGLI